MADAKSKKPARRRMTNDATTPIPMGPRGGSPDEPACGHGGCGASCSVRYVGPTTHVRDHHIMHAARGVTHIWTAAVVTGFAVVLTVAVAFNAAEAKSERRGAEKEVKAKQELSKQINRMNTQLEEMKKMLLKLAEKCSVESSTETPKPAAPTTP